MAFGWAVKAVSSGYQAVSGATRAVTHTVAAGASDVADAVGSGVADEVHLSEESAGEVGHLGQQFAGGVADWATGSWDTAKTLAEHPLETVKAVGNLATNPVIDPLGGLAKDALEGKNPIEGYQEGVSQLKDLGSSVVGGYVDEYKKNGVAGLVGNAAPDIALAFLTGGAEVAGKEGAEVAGKAVAEDVAKSVGKTSLKDTVKSGAQATVKQLGSGIVPEEGSPLHAFIHGGEVGKIGAADAAKTVGGSLIPGKTSAAGTIQQTQQPAKPAHHSLLGGLAHSFGSVF